jgi:hypothetical protein
MSNYSVEGKIKYTYVRLRSTSNPQIHVRFIRHRHLYLISMSFSQIGVQLRHWRKLSQMFTCGLSDLLLLAVGSLVVFVLREYILKVHILVSSEHKLCQTWNTCMYWSIAFLSKLLLSKHNTFLWRHTIVRTVDYFLRIYSLFFCSWTYEL